MKEKIVGFILAAGQGKRLKPLIGNHPKPLVPVCGVPVLELAVSYLSQFLSGKIIINCCYHQQKISSACQKLACQYHQRIEISREKKLLGTGGGLRNGLVLAPDAQHILVHNADVVLDYDLSFLIETHLQENSDVTVLLVPGYGPLTVEMTGNHRITSFDRPAGCGNYTFSGVHLFRRQILQMLPETNPCSIISAYRKAIEEGKKVLGLSTENSFWADTGSFPEYIHLHSRLADSGIKYHDLLRQAQERQALLRAELEKTGVWCSGALSLGKNVSVAAGTQLHNVVIWDNCKISQPSFYTEGVFTGSPRAKEIILAERKPDKRILQYLRVKEKDIQLYLLRKQASGRQYWRITVGEKSWVWCVYDRKRRENGTFPGLNFFLKQLGLNVPEVYLHLVDTGEILMSDLGDCSLQEISDINLTHQLLKNVLQQIALLHVRGTVQARLAEIPLQNGFTKGLYNWERDYFRQYILSQWLHQPHLWSPVAEEYCQWRTLLLNQTPVLLHRDLQSANILVYQNQPYLIDFQGMRKGCAAYDIAALLFDPYRCYPPEMRESLWRFYCHQVSCLGGIPLQKKIFYVSATQRLLQVLGAFGKLWLQDGLTWYKKFILPAVTLLGQASNVAGFKNLSNLAHLLKDKVKLALKE